MNTTQIKLPWDGWRIVRKIGRGTFGVVWQIEKDIWGRPGETETAAAKIISIPKDEDDIEDLRREGYDNASIKKRYDSYRQKFVDEYAHMAELRSFDNIVHCEDLQVVPHADGIGWDIFIRMELLTPLKEVFGKRNPTDAEVVKVGRDICRALTNCERAGLMHRDIKPDNILVSRDGTFKLGDFGTAKAVEHTSSGTSAGTERYMSPEMFHNQPYGPRADLYSLGLTLYWLLNEKRSPFVPMPPNAVTVDDEYSSRFRRMKGEDLPSPRHGCAALKEIVLKACSYRPEDRYADAKAMYHALDILSRSLEPGPVTPDYSPDPIHRNGGSPAQDETVPMPPSPPPAPKPDDEDAKPKAPEDRRLNKTLLRILAGTAAVLAAAVLCIIVLPKVFSSSPAPTPTSAVTEQPEVTADPVETVAPSPTEAVVVPSAAAASQEPAWSDWVENLSVSVNSDEYVIREKRQYRSAPLYLVEDSGEEELPEGFRVYRTEYTEWSDWSETWGTADAATLPEADDLIEYDTQTLYRYDVSVPHQVSNQFHTYTWTEYTLESRESSYGVPANAQNVRTLVRYRTRTRERRLYCYDEREWSAFSDTVMQPDEDTAVNIRTLYSCRAKTSGDENAVPGIGNFPEVRGERGTRFADVEPSAWYGAENQDCAGIAVRLGALSPDDFLRFRPEEDITLSEVLQAAVVLYRYYNGEQGILAGVGYIDYALSVGIIDIGDFSDYSRPATRAEAAYILWRTLPQTEFASRNTVSTITDMDLGSKYYSAVYQLAQAGVVSWPSPEYAFSPEDNITRAESAALVTRLAYPDARLS